jgi:hypothetical protein
MISRSALVNLVTFHRIHTYAPYHHTTENPAWVSSNGPGLTGPRHSPERAHIFNLREHFSAHDFFRMPSDSLKQAAASTLVTYGLTPDGWYSVWLIQG